MFIRIVQPQIRPGKARAAATRWQEFAGPLMRQNPHLRHGYMAVNGDRTSMVVVTFWDLIPGAEANSLFEPEIRAVMQDMMSGPPGPFEEYEVIAQI